MLIIPKDLLFKHATVNNVHYGSDRKPFWEEFFVLIDLICLITSADFNQLLIDLKLVIIDFRISADSQPYYSVILYRNITNQFPWIPNYKIYYKIMLIYKVLLQITITSQ